jgi:pyridoxine kinase
MQDMLDGLSRIIALDDVDAVLTGYFADAEQVGVVAKTLPHLKARHILIDPVIGDHGALYVGEAVAEAIRDQLLPLATIITPNLFELQWLSQRSEVEEAVARLGVAETLVTSVPDGVDKLATRLFTSSGSYTQTASRLAKVPHGTGDMLAGLYLAHRITQPPATAFALAIAGLEHVIAASEGSPSLQVVNLRTAR